MLGKIFRFWREIFLAYRRIATMRLLVLGVLVGVFSGLAAVAFFWAVEIGKHFFIAHLAGIIQPAPAGEELIHAQPGPYRPWLIPIFTCSVGLITGFLVSKFIPETISSGTDGTDATINAFHNQLAKVKPRIWLIKGFTSIFTIATGGSAGREGPITQVGAGIGSFISQKLRLSARERRLMLLAGAAGGLGAIFRAPLGGALTAIEVVYREDFETEAILPAVISSVVAYSIFTFFFGTDPIFGIPHFAFSDPRELIFYGVLALACAAVGWFYVRCFYFIKYSIFFRIKDKVGLAWSTAFGGLLMGLMGIFFPQVLTGGYGWLEMAIMGELPVMMMLAIIVGKTIATSMTIGSGMSGGMFAPALFVGGMTGGLVGEVSHHFYPDIVTQPGGYVLVGMASFFAAVANAPIGPLIMVCELTQGYGLLAPLMLASALCIVLGRKYSLYEHQVDTKFDSPAHVEDATINILEQLTVADYLTQGTMTTLEEATTLKALTDIVANTNELAFPVRNEEEDISGMLTLGKVRAILFEQTLFELIVVGDIMDKPATLFPEDDLYTALLKFVDTDYAQIPVVSPDDPHTIVGRINREDVFKAYAQAIKEVRRELDEAGHAGIPI